MSIKNKDLTPIIESPDVHYVIPADKLSEILANYGFDKKSFEKLYNNLKKYEDVSITKEIVHGMSSNKEKIKMPRVIDALFYIPKTKKTRGRYIFLKIKLAPSSIKNAGTGVYALEDIPKGAKSFYKGIRKEDEDINPYYSWTIKSYDDETGEQDSEDEPLYYVDAFDIKTSNWTRYVNCGMKNKYNNMESEQKYDKIYYIATRNIKKGEELFIDYGEDYRKDNLNMKGKY